MKPEDIISFSPSAFFPATSYKGTEPPFIIRGENLWLKARGDGVTYASGYKGSADIGETLETTALSGTIAWTTGSAVITGTNFYAELVEGMMLVTAQTPSECFAVVELLSDTQARVSRAFTTTDTGVTVHILPILYPLAQKRVSHTWGQIARYPRGHYIGVGGGEVRLNGEKFNVRQEETMTVVGTVTGSGDITVTVTASGMAGSPIGVTVAVTSPDTASQVATKIITALQGNATINAFFTFRQDGADVIARVQTATANDATMNFAYAQTTATGLTDQPTSVNTVVGQQYLLTKSPKFAIYDPDSDSFIVTGFGLTLPTADPLFSLAQQAGGVKDMEVGYYGIRLVARSDANSDIGGTGGYSNPSANIVLQITVANQKIRITFLDNMNVSEGQNAWDIYVTKFLNATDNQLNATQGIHYFYETVTAEQIATYNSVTDGTVSGLYWDVEFADGELDALDTLITFDNFAPYDAGYVDLISTGQGSTPIFFSCLGKRTSAQKEGTSLGGTVVPAKPDNPEGLMRDKAVGTFLSDTILGVLNARGRFWLLCTNTLQTALLTGIDDYPITIRSHWDVGFGNRYNMMFLKDYSFAFTNNGLVRSISIGDESTEDFQFALPVNEYVDDWLAGHAFAEYCPKNKAVCFFFSGKERRSGYWVTMVLPYLPHQGIWNPPIILSKTNADFIVSGVARVGQALYFSAGGRTSLGAMESKTYEFDANDGVEYNCYLAWSYTDLGQENMPQSVQGLASVIGDLENCAVEIHGVPDEGLFDLTTLETGHDDDNFTISIPDTSGFGRVREIRQSMDAYSKWTPRVEFTSTNGAGRLDELNLLVKMNASRR